MQRRQRRPLAVDIDRDDRQVVTRRQEIERHHNAVIEFPFLGIGDVDSLHDFTRDARAEIRGTGHFRLLNLEPFRIFDRAFVGIPDADAERRHVVHEEIGEVLGRDDDQRFRAAVLDVLALLVELCIERVTHLRVLAKIGAPGDTRRMTQDA